MIFESIPVLTDNCLCAYCALRLEAQTVSILYEYSMCIQIKQFVNILTIFFLLYIAHSRQID